MTETKPELWIPLSAAREMTKAVDPLAAMSRETSDLSGLARTLGGPNAITSLGPGVPIGPAHPEELYPRLWDYTPGYNIGIRPRSYEAFDYSTLFALANNWDVAGLCIEKRIDDFVKHPWVIQPRAVEGQSRKDTLARRLKYGDAIAKATGFFMTPDQVNPWSSWIGKYMDDLWKGDCASVYLHPNRGGDLYAAEVIDGQTIRPIIDLWGRRPLVPPDVERHQHDWYQTSKPAAMTLNAYASVTICSVCGASPAFCSVIKGMNWVWLGSDELIWQPRWLHGQGPYGHPPAEWIIISINRALRRQSIDLSLYTEGTIPAAFVKFPESWTTQQGLDFLSAVNAMFAGNDVARSRLMPIPGGPNSGVERVNAEPSDVYEEFLLHIGCAAYGQSPIEMGFVRGPSGGLGGGKTAAGTQAVASQERDVSLANHLKWAVLDRILATYWDPELEFVFTDLKPSEDMAAQADMDKFAVSVGAISPDWIAENRYDTDGPGLPNTIMTAQGQPMLVSDFLKGPSPTPPPGAPPVSAPAGARPVRSTDEVSSPPPPPAPSAEPGVLTGDSPGAPAAKALGGKGVEYTGDLAKHVHEYLLRSYPPKDVEWVLDADWEYDPSLPLGKINMARRPGGRDPQKVGQLEDTLSNGASMDPVIIVDLGDPAGYTLADGWHRTLGAEKAGEDKVPAFIGTHLPDGAADVITGAMQADSMGATADLAKADLTKWERKSSKALRMGKNASVAFVSEHIPMGIAQRIREDLTNVTTPAGIKLVFAKADPLGEPDRPLAPTRSTPATSSPRSGPPGSASRARPSPAPSGAWRERYP
jgi:hypothetical protein